MTSRKKFTEFQPILGVDHGFWVRIDRPRRRTLILERPPSPRDLFDGTDRRLLVRTFGAEVVDGCEVVCMWNDLALDHDWIVAVLRDVRTSDHFVCEHLASDDHRFVQVELFSSKAYSRIVSVLKNDETPEACHEIRLEELAAAADAANAAIDARMRYHEGLWARKELAMLGRPEAALHGYLQPGSC